MSAIQHLTGKPFRCDFRSSDPLETVSFVSEALAPHAMKLKSPRPMATRLSSIDLGSAQIVDLQYGTDVWIDPAALQGSHLVHTAISGRSTMWHDARRCTIEPGSLHVASPGARLKVDMTGECRHLTVRIAHSAFEDHLGQELNISVGRPLLFDPDVVEHGILPLAWNQLLSHIVQQADSLPELFANPRLQRQYVTMMVELLLSHHRSNYSDLVAQEGNDVAPWHVQRARAIIHESVDESISIVQVAAQVGVSVRSLQTGFRRFFGLTPVQYVRRHRLELLHSALTNAQGDERVTDLMLDCGIVNFGRYAQYYRRRYGCSPSETLRSPARH